MDTQRYSAFDGHRRIATGPLSTVAPVVHRAQTDAAGPLLLFNHRDGSVVDLDMRGSVGDMLARLGVAPMGRGRPRLGVTAREVTLLPRHWDWLAAQPGGASVALRRLVEAARRDDATNRRGARDAGYRFMAAIAGDLPGFEAASRALFADNDIGFAAATADWPADITATIADIIGAAAPAPAE